MSHAPQSCFSLLSRTERAGIWLGEACARRLPDLPVWMSRFPMGPLVWAAIGRRLRLLGLEHVRGLGEDSSVLFVANHRSFFDYFAVSVVLRRRAGFGHRLYFPVRSEFFYDHPAGVAVNLLAAGMSMYPPIFRHGPKRALNPWSLERCAERLARPGTSIGLHPEGTRNQGPDPFQLLRARSGPGRIALLVPRARVVPAFVLGLGNRVLDEVRYNLREPARHPIWMAFGPEVDLSEQRRQPEGAGARAAAERCRDAILALGEEVRREMAAAGPERPGEPGPA